MATRFTLMEKTLAAAAAVILVPGLTWTYIKQNADLKQAVQLASSGPTRPLEGIVANGTQFIIIRNNDGSVTPIRLQEQISNAEVIGLTIVGIYHVR